MAEYYQIKKERQIYHGVRIFRFNYDNPYVTQICLGTGEAKRGKGHYVGIYLISRESFLANYLGMSVDRCTKAKFDKEFKNLTSKLK